jgi:hypothetical protein
VLVHAACQTELIDLSAPERNLPFTRSLQIASIAPL